MRRIMIAPARRQRLDIALVDRSLAENARSAQALISAGLVEVDGVRASSAAHPVDGTAFVRVTGRDRTYASRAGMKLAAALEAFAVDPAGRVALDAGASTGGFTDVLLSRGASMVYAVDVGRGLLDSRLADDERVVVLDRTNLRLLDSLPATSPTLVTLDLSFISLRTVWGRVTALAAPGADVVALFKPQFELSREVARDRGVVLDNAVGEAAARDFIEWAAGASGAVGAGPIPAPVRGARGNQEWLVHVKLASGGAHE